MDNFLLEELRFCKLQISTYTALYEKLLSKYLNVEERLPATNPGDVGERLPAKDTKPADVETTEDDNELTASILNFICKSESDKSTRRSEEAGKSNEENGKSIDVVRNPDTYENADTNRKLIRKSAKEEDNDMKSIDDRKQAARNGLQAHNSKLVEIHAEEQRLLALGMDPKLVYQRVREKYYPEAIPASERKVPSIMVDTRDENGKLLRKQVNLLAFDNESDSNEESPESPFMDSPVMESPEDTDAIEDIVDETPI